MGGKNQNDHSGWMLKATGCISEPVSGLSGHDNQMDQSIRSVLKI
jgi:hypothetical protein